MLDSLGIGFSGSVSKRAFSLDEIVAGVAVSIASMEAIFLLILRRREGLAEVPLLVRDSLSWK